MENKKKQTNVSETAKHLHRALELICNSPVVTEDSHQSKTPPFTNEETLQQSKAQWRSLSTANFKKMIGGLQPQSKEQWVARRGTPYKVQSENGTDIFKRHTWTLTSHRSQRGE